MSVKSRSAVLAVLVLTTFDADELVMRPLPAGAAGFLLKHAAPSEIIRAIEAVDAGEGSLSPETGRRLIALVASDCDVAARQDSARTKLDSLTTREREVALAIGWNARAPRSRAISS